MSIASPEREATETATAEAVQSIEGATPSISKFVTLDELLATEARQREEKLRLLDEENKRQLLQLREEALEHTRTFFASVLDEPTRAALELTYTYSDELGESGVVATFTVDGTVWQMCRLWNQGGKAIRIASPDGIFLDFAATDFAHELLGQILAWRSRDASKHETDMQRGTVAAPEPVVLYADVARGVKAYIIGAESACGGLDQLRFTLARFTRSGDIEVERYDANNYDAHSQRGTWERFSLPSNLAGQIASLRAAWLEETKTQPSVGDDGIPF